MAAPAEQSIDRLVARLADDVPQGDFDTTDCRHHRGAALILIANHVADDRLDIKRIAAEHPALDPPVAQRLDGPLLPLERRFADAAEAGIGREAQEEVVAQTGIREEGFKTSDFHRWSRVFTTEFTEITEEALVIVPRSVFSVISVVSRSAQRRSSAHSNRVPRRAGRALQSQRREDE